MQYLKPFLDLGYLYTLQVDGPSLDPAFLSLLSILFSPRQEANYWREAQEERRRRAPARARAISITGRARSLTGEGLAGPSAESKRDRIPLSHWWPRPPTQQDACPGNPSSLCLKCWTDPGRWEEATTTWPWPWCCCPLLTLGRMGFLKAPVPGALRRCHRRSLANT